MTKHLNIGDWVEIDREKLLSNDHEKFDAWYGVVKTIEGNYGDEPYHNVDWYSNYPRVGAPDFSIKYYAKDLTFIPKNIMDNIIKNLSILESIIENRGGVKI